MSAILLAFDKCEQLIHLRHELAVAAEDFAGRIDADLGAINQAVGLGQAIDDVRGKLVAFERDDIDAPRPGRCPLRTA